MGEVAIFAIEFKMAITYGPPVDCKRFETGAAEQF